MNQEIVNNNKCLTSQGDPRARILQYSYGLFQGLLNEDINERSKALKKIESTVKKLVKTCYPPGLSTPEVNTTQDNNNTSDGDTSIDNNPITPLSSKRSSPTSTNESTSASASSAVSQAASPKMEDDTSSSTTSPTVTSPTVTSPKPYHEVTSSDILNAVNNNNLGLHQNSLEDNENNIENPGEILRIIILVMLRMSIDYPLADIRKTFQEFLIKLRRIGVPVPKPIHPTPSRYIPPEDTLTLEWLSHSRAPSSDNDEGEESQPTLSPSSDNDESELSQPTLSPPSDNDEGELSQPTLSSPENASNIVGQQPDQKSMIDTFLNLSHYYRVLSYFPRFMKRYQNSFYKIVESPGPLKRSDRYYIGIMAVSQHSSQYLISRLKNDFLLYGGEAKWLDGLQHAPVKIRKLAQINSILAHQPWRLQKSHIGDLIKGPNPLDNWALPEVVHIILVLSTFHSLSSFVISCGIVPEYDCLGGYQNDEETTTTGSSLGILDSSHQTSQEVAEGIGITLNNDTTKTTTTEIVTATTEATVDESINETTTGATVDESINETTGLESSSQSSPSEKPPNTPPSLRTNNFSLYLDPNIEITYDDFSFSSEEYALRDYKWADQGVFTVNEALPNVGEVLDKEFSEIVLDKEFSEIKSMTDYSNVSPLSHQIWVYVQRLLGLQQDDYINNDKPPLDNGIKDYLKKVCTVPELITEEDWKNINYQRTEEKCHLTLIAVEARKQTELIYGLWNVMKWNSTKGEKNDDEK